MNNDKDDKILKALGESLQNKRKSRGLSMRNLAALCKVDHSDIGKIEKGQINITMLTLFDLAEALEISPNELLDFV